MTATARAASSDENAQSTPAVTWALAGLSLSLLLSSLGTSIANVALPELARAFDASFQAVQWIVLAYLLAITSLIVSIGRLGDLFGRRRLLLAGLLLFTSASVLCGLAPTLGVLLAGRALQGLGAAAMMALTMAFVGEIVPKAQTGRAMGLLGTMSAVGTALGPSLGGLLIAAAGWRTMFLLNVPLGLTAFFLVLRTLPLDRDHSAGTRQRFDGLGTALLAAALAAYALAMTVGRGHFTSLNATLLASAAGAVVLFVLAEAKVSAPLIRLSLLRQRTLRDGLVASGLVTTVMMTTLVVGPFYLSFALGLRSSAVGLVLSLGPLVAALMSVPAGRLVDRLGTPRITTLGLVGLASGTVALALLPAPLGITSYILPIVAVTVCYALFQTANNTAVMRDVPTDQRGVVSGMLNLSRNLGLVTGASLMGAVFATASGSSDVTTASPAAIAAGMRVTFGVAGILILIALAVLQSGRGRSAPGIHPRRRALFR